MADGKKRVKGRGRNIGNGTTVRVISDPGPSPDAAQLPLGLFPEEEAAKEKAAKEKADREKTDREKASKVLNQRAADNIVSDVESRIEAGKELPDEVIVRDPRTGLVERKRAQSLFE